jgi:hypothetical protein
LTTDTDSVSTFGTIRVHPPGPTDSSSITTGTSTSASIATCHHGIPSHQTVF